MHILNEAQPWLGETTFSCSVDFRFPYSGTLLDSRFSTVFLLATNNKLVFCS